MSSMTAKELIEKMAAEIGRLQKLCKDNGINYLPLGMNPNASLKVSSEVKVFKSKQEAEEYQKKISTNVK